MLAKIRHTAVLVLGFVLLALVMACGDTAATPTVVSIPEPTPDIEATVEARIQEKQAEDAALEAKAQAMVEATAQAAPTATPLPPTPTPTHTPTPPSSISILTNAKKAMAALESYHYDLLMVIKAGGEGMEIEIPVNISGDFKAPDRIRETMSIAIFGMQLETTYIRVGDQTYVKEPMPEWTATYEFEGFDVNEMWSGDDESIFDIPIAAEPALEEVDGTTVYHMKWDLTEGSQELIAFLNFFGDGDDEDIPENLKIEFWIDVESYYLKKFVLNADIPIDEEGEDPLFSGLGADASGTGSLTMEVTLSAFNEDLPSIIAPAIATPTPTPTLLTETYRNEMSGFSIDYPVNWEVMEWTQESTTIVEIAQPLGSFVRVEIEYAPTVALEDFVASRLSSEDNFREDRRLKVESLPGYLSEGIGSDSQTPINILMTTNDPWAISAMFESARDLGERDQPIFQAMIESFQIFPPTTAKN